MIKNLEHAQQVQQRRFEKGLKGYAKAVRNFMSKKLGDDYQKERSKLPVNWKTS